MTDIGLKTTALQDVRALCIRKNWYTCGYNREYNNLFDMIGNGAALMDMLFYQYKPNANPFIKAIIFSAIASFVIQPFFAWIGFYNPQGWKHEYSFPIIIGIYLIGFLFTKARDFQVYGS